MAAEAIDFRPYETHDPPCPVTRITPSTAPFIHTFFDVSPWSPSGRYLACLRLPFEDRPPGPDDTADVCVIDLQARTIQKVYTTTGWGMQTAAHQVWGTTDEHLYFNDKRAGRPVGIECEWQSGSARVLDGPVYQVSPDGTYAVSPCLVRTNHTQGGYGVAVSAENDVAQPLGASDEDGLWRVDFATGSNALFLSFRRVYDMLPDKREFDGGTFYGFHAKFNRQGTRIMFVARCRFPDGSRKNMVVTTDPEARSLALAVPWHVWAKGGHHPDWHPDGERVLMNLDTRGRGMQFYEVLWNGSEPRTLVPDIPGSGHPSWRPDGQFILTDAYPSEPVCSDEAVPIRLIDTVAARETTICRMWTLGDGLGETRCDPHPVWRADGNRVCFTGAPDGRRQLFIADVSSLICR